MSQQEKKKTTLCIMIILKKFEENIKKAQLYYTQNT